MKKLISPTIHEATVSRHKLGDDVVLDAMVNAARSVREAVEKAETSAELIRADRSMAPIVVERKVRETTFRLLDTATVRVDSTRGRAEEVVAELEKKTAPPPPRDAKEQLMHGEIRATLAKMSHETRSATIAKAIAEGDDLTVSAALSGPAYLAGLGDAERVVRLHAWRAARFPAETARIERLKKAATDLDRVAKLAHQHVDHLTDAGAVAAAEQAEQRAREAANAA